MASNKKKDSRNKKLAGYNVIPLISVIAIAALAFTVYIAYRTSISEKKLFSVSLLAMFGGLLLESFRVSNKWKNVIYIFIGSYSLSMLNFLPGKREHNYSFENHIESWPYTFFFIFAIAFTLSYKGKVTAKLTEGITLLQSISLIYWAIDYGFTNYHNWLAILVFIITLAFTAFAILNALTTLQLTNTTRLILSIWSTTIMVAFALDNIIRVFNNENIETTEYLSGGLYIGIQYFFLGVSTIYILQNLILLVQFLPSSNGNYLLDLKENKTSHINRFSEHQVSIKKSCICILFSTISYTINYSYQILPRHTMIWLVFLTFPILLYLMPNSKIPKTPPRIGGVFKRNLKKYT